MVGIGYSDNPDSFASGKQAASEALSKAGQVKLGRDFVLLFAPHAMTSSSTALYLGCRAILNPFTGAEPLELLPMTSSVMLAIRLVLSASGLRG